MSDDEKPKCGEAEGSEKDGLQGDGEDFAFHGFESGGIVRRPRSTVSDEAGATTDSVFDSDTSAGFTPLSGFTQLPQGEQFATGAAFALNLRKPTVGAGAESCNAGRNHPSVVESDKPFTRVGVATH